MHIWALIDECVEQHEAEQGNQKRNNCRVDFCVKSKKERKKKKRIGKQRKIGGKKKDEGKIKNRKKTSAPVKSVSNLTGVNQEVAAVCIDETAARESLNYGRDE